MKILLSRIMLCCVLVGIEGSCIWKICIHKLHIGCSNPLCCIWGKIFMPKTKMICDILLCILLLHVSLFVVIFRLLL